MTPAAAIRPMARGDRTSVQAVAVDAGERFRAFPEPRIAACADHEPWSFESLDAFVDEGRAWVATVDGVVVGYLLAEVLDGAAHVEEVSVGRGHGGRGIGTALLDAAAAWAGRQGLAAVTLTTFRDVPWNRPFYERRGFRVVDDDDRSEALRARVAHEDEAFGLPEELRVVMRRDLRPTAG